MTKTTGTETGSQIFSNTPHLCNELFEDWRKYIFDTSGIYFQDNKKYLLESRLFRRINFLGLRNYEDYFRFIKHHPGASAERDYLFEAITINETYFFRNIPQLEALVKNIIPRIIESRKGNQKKIRIWSAGSSSGEEPYSVSIYINEFLIPKYPDFVFEITGTDINNHVLETARSGIYKHYAVRNAPSYYLEKYFTKKGNIFELHTSIRKSVNFRLLNLYDEEEMKAMFNFDIIICANVLIYFNQESKIKVVNNFYNSLNKGGYFFIGYSETLKNISNAFKILSYPKTIVYKKEY